MSGSGPGAVGATSKVGGGTGDGGDVGVAVRAGEDAVAGGMADGGDEGRGACGRLGEIKRDGEGEALALPPAAPSSPDDA